MQASPFSTSVHNLANANSLDLYRLTSHCTDHRNEHGQTVHFIHPLGEILSGPYSIPLANITQLIQAI